MQKDDVIKAAKLIEARCAIGRLLVSLSMREEDASPLMAAAVALNGSIFETEVEIPRDIIILGLHRMVEECGRQLRMIEGYEA